VVFYIFGCSQKTWGLDPERVDHVCAAGVESVFFVISGFVMAMIVARPGAFNGQGILEGVCGAWFTAYWVDQRRVVFVLACSCRSCSIRTTADLYNLVASLSFVCGWIRAMGSDCAVAGARLDSELRNFLLCHCCADLPVCLQTQRKLVVGIGLMNLSGHSGDIAGKTAIPIVGVLQTDPILLEFVLGHSWFTGQGVNS